VTETFILPLDSLKTDLQLVGGKGANLSILTRAGYPVPSGFHITTPAYKTFIEEHHLDNLINSTLENLTRDSSAVEQASRAIRSAFQNYSIPPDLVQEILQAYQALGSPYVAVRSSATAEDLPELSFAGQQDTFLNVMGESSLLKAIIDCWSSLWTARAISYRSHSGISHKDISLAVIVQKMIDSETSGILFTANPLTGARCQSVIDASFGLGEAIVSGMVEPDEYVVNHKLAGIVNIKLGSKESQVVPQIGGGTVQVTSNERHQALSNSQILELADVGQKIAKHYGAPQDIEWAVERGIIYILQSRPITSLYPIPDTLTDDPLQVLISFGAVQGIMDPITPLGQDVLKLMFCGGARLFGYRQNYLTGTALHTAAERLFVNVTPIFSNAVGRKLGLKALTVADPAVQQTMVGLKTEPRLMPRKNGVSPHTFFRLARFILPRMTKTIQFIAQPEKKRQQALDTVERFLAGLAAESHLTGTIADKLTSRVDRIEKTAELFPLVVPVLVPALMAGIGPLYILNNIAGSLAKQLNKPELALAGMEVTRGMPNNVTTQMDLALWHTTQEIGIEPANHQWMRQYTHEDLASQYLSGQLPDGIARPIAEFLTQYGMRGACEIDIGRKRWRENPSAVMQSIKNYLTITDEHQAPDTVFQRGQQQAEVAIQTLIDAARMNRFGPIKAWFVKFAARRIRALAGLRESPKFTIIRAMGIIRNDLLMSGADLVQSGQLEKADDLFFLRYEELQDFASGIQKEWKAIIASHRTVWEREKRRRQIPRLILTDGRTYYEGLNAGSGTKEGQLKGSPVSAGTATGRVRVILDPNQADLQPGEILVCPGTDPSWTPLFLLASALVMEVGGLMTHGAVVAREYGIPAIVGVHQATTRLETGMHISVDGSSGVITILPDD